MCRDLKIADKCLPEGDKVITCHLQQAQMTARSVPSDICGLVAPDDESLKSRGEATDAGLRGGGGSKYFCVWAQQPPAPLLSLCGLIFFLATFVFL